ncbi:MAG: secondary thiamine-phosphate synthase enzyme YjbQ [Phycisphaerae bacterium]|nr:secondary thiamine-phosphate synthase enzyme YjbQ [Phycisphaerae bacterium]
MTTSEFNVRTPRHDCLVDITAEVESAVKDSGAQEGFAVVFVPHTTAAVTINENADPDVMHDVLKQLNEIVPWRQPFYQHGEGNSAAHVKSSMLGCSETVALSAGRLTLGTWQGIYFAEFDGPRSRRVIVQVVAAAAEA